MIRRLNPRWFGRRGAFLLMFGLMWTVTGYSRTTTPPTDQQLEAARVLLEIAPYRTWGMVWLLAGVTAIVAAFFREPGADYFGFAALIAPVLVYAGSSLWMFVFNDYEPGAQAVGIYAALIVALFLVAGWPEARR